MENSSNFTFFGGRHWGYSKSSLLGHLTHSVKTNCVWCKCAFAPWVWCLNVWKKPKLDEQIIGISRRPIPGTVLHVLSINAEHSGNLFSKHAISKWISVHGKLFLRTSASLIRSGYDTKPFVSGPGTQTFGLSSKSASG